MQNTTYAVSLSTVPHKKGDFGMPYHSFEDFDMPKVFALITPINEYGMKSARVYTPNPWYPNYIGFYDWVWSKDDGMWRRTQSIWAVQSS
jgi:hypothetical protein